jgi:hypothetical protein
MITEWSHHPLTEAMLHKVKDMLEANKEDLLETVLNVSLGKIDSHILSQVKGQIYILQAIFNIKEFLLELTEDEVNNEHKGSRAEDIS